jgi:putative membrane protein
MRLSPRRTLWTLFVAGSIVLGAPALGYAQQQHSADEARYGPAPGSPDAAGFTPLSPSGSFDLHQDGNDTLLAFANDSADDSDNPYGDETLDNGNDNDNVVASSDEADFLRAALSDSATEIHVGELAQQQGGSAEIRQLGTRMVSESQAVMTDAQSVAARYGLQAQQPASGEEQQRIEDLASRSGDDFNRAYLKSLVWDQRNDIEEFSEAEGALRDDVAELANQHLSTLESELRAAQDAADILGVDVD